MCFKVWNELCSCLSHAYNYPADQTDCIQDGYHGDSDDDDFTDDKHSTSHDIQHSSLFTMDAIQLRLQHLLDQPEEENRSLASFNLFLANQEIEDDHTSKEPDSIDHQNQVMLHNYVLYIT